MADYALKYRTEFKGHMAWHSYKIELHQLGYTGPVYDRKLGAAGGARLVKDEGETIQSISLEFTIQCLTDFEFVELFTPNARKIKVILYKDTVAMYTGFLVQNIHREPWRDPQFHVTLTAVTGLKLLQQIDFIPIGVQPVINVLRYCIIQTQNFLNHSIASTLVEDTMAGTHCLTEAEINTDAYTDKSFYEVLEDLLQNFNLRLEQHNNVWAIYDLADLQATHYHYTSLLDSGTAVTAPTLQTMVKEASTQNNQVWVNGRLTLELTEGCKGVNYSFSAGSRKNQIENANLLNGLIDDWDTSGFDTSYTRNIVTVSTKDNTYKGIIPADRTQAVAYITQSINGLIATTDQQIHFTVKTVALKQNSAATASFMLILVGSAATYYLQSDGSWTTTLYKHELSLTGIQPTDLVDTSFTKFEITTDSLPVDGDLEARIYNHYVPYAYPYYEACIALFKDIELNIVDEELLLYPDVTTTLKRVNDDLFNGDTHEKEFTFGDVPGTADNHVHIYAGAIDVDGSPSVSWNGYNLMQEIANRQIHQAWYSLFALQGNVRGKDIHTQLLFKHPYKLERAYYFASGSYNLVRETLEGTFKEWSYGNALFKDAMAVFCLQTPENLINVKGDWATIESGYIRFPELGNDVFNKDNTTYWDAAIKTDLYYDATNPRDWLYGEFTNQLAEYATTACSDVLFFRQYITGLKDSVLPILVYNNAVSADLAIRINKTLRNDMFIVEGDEYITETDALIIQ